MDKHPSTKNIREQLRELRQYKNELQAEHSKLQREIESLQREQSANEVAIRDSEAMILRMRNRNQEVDSLIEGLLSGVTEVDSKIRNLDEQLSQLTNTIEK